MKLNKNFEFDMRDIDTIEMALRKKDCRTISKINERKGRCRGLERRNKRNVWIAGSYSSSKELASPKRGDYVSG